jgi:hypothetical protein
MSSTRQAGRSGADQSRNAFADGNVCTANPADRSRRARARQMDASSSTTYTTGSDA